MSGSSQAPSNVGMFTVLKELQLQGILLEEEERLLWMDANNNLWLFGDRTLDGETNYSL